MHLAPADCQVEVERLIQDATHQPFDLTAAPLLRVVLVRLGEMDHLLHFVLHHIVCDGWSMTVLAHELSALYNAYTAGQPSPLPKLPIQYADFAHWQRERMQGEVLAGEVAYWRQQLQNSPPLLELPTDHPRPSTRTYHGQRVSSVLSADLVKALKSVGRQEGATLFMTLLAAYQLLLSRHSGLEDVVVGTPVAGRVRAEFEGLIGVFINNLVLRTDLTGHPSFRELLKRTRAVSLQAQAHQEVPFEKIVEVMQPERALSHTPLFQVMFNMLNFESTKVALAGLDVSFDLPPDTGANFDMTLYAVEREGRIELSLVYDASLFGHARMVELLNQYGHLLQQVAAQPDRDIGEFSLVTAESRRLLADPTETLAQPFYPPVPHVFPGVGSRVTGATRGLPAWPRLDVCGIGGPRARAGRRDAGAWRHARRRRRRDGNAKLRVRGGHAGGLDEWRHIAHARPEAARRTPETHAATRGVPARHLCRRAENSGRMAVGMSDHGHSSHGGING